VLGPIAAVVFARELAGMLGLAGEQRLRAPALDEALEAAVLELAREGLVGDPALRAARLLLDAGARRDEHQPGHAARRAQRDLQGDATAQRVPAQRETRGRAGEDVRDAGGERDRALARHRPVSGQVERQRQVAFGAQARRHAVPGMARAAEAVQQDDPLRHIAIVVS